MTDDVANIGKNFFHIFHAEGCVFLPPLPPCPQRRLFHLLYTKKKCFVTTLQLSILKLSLLLCSHDSISRFSIWTLWWYECYYDTEHNVVILYWSYAGVWDSSIVGNPRRRNLKKPVLRAISRNSLFIGNLASMKTPDYHNVGVYEQCRAMISVYWSSSTPGMARQTGHFGSSPAEQGKSGFAIPKPLISGPSLSSA